MKSIAIIVLFLIASPAAAQVYVGSGASPPASCKEGEVFFDTDQNVDTNGATTNDNTFLVCVTGTWTEYTGIGAGSVAGTSLDSGEAAGVNDLRYDATQNAWFLDQGGSSAVSAEAGDPIFAAGFVRRVVDINASGTITDEDIQAAIDSCGVGFTSAGGCVVEVGRTPGTATPIIIDAPILIGDANCDSTPSLGPQVAVSLRGQGMAQLAQSGGGDSAGTVLAWGGADGGTMIQICSGIQVEVDNISLRMDPDNVGNDGDEAHVGVLVSANNADSLPTQMVSLRRMQIIGATQGQTADSASIGISIDGQADNDQIDKMAIDQVRIFRVGTGIRNQTQQAIHNLISDSEIFGQTYALHMRLGSLNASDTIFGVDSGGALFKLGDATSPTPFQVTLDRIYVELGGTGSTVFDIGQNSDPATDTGSIHPIVLQNSYIVNQCTPNPCTHNLVNGALRTKLIIQGTNFKRSSSDRTWNIDISSPVSANTRGEFVFSNNDTGDSDSTRDIFSTVTITGDVIVNHFEMDEATGVLFNDKDFDWVKDPGEAMQLGTYRFSAGGAAAAYVANYCFANGYATNTAPADCSTATNNPAFVSYMMAGQGMVRDIACANTFAASGYDAGDQIVLALRFRDGTSNALNTATITLPANRAVGLPLVQTINEAFEIAGPQNMSLNINSLTDTGTGLTNYLVDCNVRVWEP